MIPAILVAAGASALANAGRQAYQSSRAFDTDRAEGGKFWHSFGKGLKAFTRPILAVSTLGLSEAIKGDNGRTLGKSLWEADSETDSCYRFGLTLAELNRCKALATTRRKQNANFKGFATKQEFIDAYAGEAQGNTALANIRQNEAVAQQQIADAAVAAEDAATQAAMQQAGSVGFPTWGYAVIGIALVAVLGLVAWKFKVFK